MKYIKYLSYILLAISAVVIILLYSSGGSDAMVTLALDWTAVLFGVCLVAAICLPFFFRKGKGLKSTLIKVGVLVVLCGVSYLLASGADLQVATNVEPTAGELKFTDAGLIMTIILFGLAVLSIISGVIISTVRNR